MSNVIYVGRAVEGVITNQLYQYRPEKTIALLEEKYPLIGLLFVPLEEYATAVKDIEMHSGEIWQAYEQTKGGRKNG